MNADSFDRFGPQSPSSPVVISVPHAGRDYPLALRAALNVPLAALIALEDRYIDVLAHAVCGGGEIMLVQRSPRAWIDLNRAEHERDPRIDDGADPRAQSIQSAKLRSGLGLIPRRVPGVGDIWKRRFGDIEVRARIASDHRPYHAALAATLAAARARFGVAVLIDLHSMPSLGADPETPRIIFGDRFGRSAAARFVHRLEGEAMAAGIASATNSPYAGGHILDRHADPAKGIHAIQIEVDRGLYLDPVLDQPGEGIGEIANVLRNMIAALADEALAGGLPLAAE